MVMKIVRLIMDSVRRICLLLLMISTVVPLVGLVAPSAAS